MAFDFTQKYSLADALAQIKPAQTEAAAAARARWNSLAKPLYSLGLLEEAVCRIAAAQGSADVKLDKPALVIMCADNGVVAEGVSQVGQEVTATVTENFVRNSTSVAVMSAKAGVDIFPVDIGVNHEFSQAVYDKGLINRKLAWGTKNMVQEPAMSRAETEKAIEVGLNLAVALAEQGYNVLATGEMGIGNTTTSSAILAVLLQEPVEKMTGIGSGLTRAGIKRKQAAISNAIRLHNPDPQNPLQVLAAVGGLDIAGLVGVFLGGALCGVPVLIDGVISGAAALLAQRICPEAADYMLASHCSKEPSGQLILQALGQRPIIQADMCLGEGTGAVAVLPVLQLALTVYDEMRTFEETSIEDYNDLVEK